MLNRVWNQLLVAPACISVSLIMAAAASASEVTVPAVESSQAAALQWSESMTEATTSPSDIALENQPNLPEASLQPGIAEQPVITEQPSLTADAAILDAMTQYTNTNVDAYSSDPMAQVTSITQFSDVQPTDWAYQALQSLVERYGCIVGYPDGTYRGQRALTRFEFAAGMNACLDRISELLAASTADLATREDLATLQRLQEEFATELAVLRGRVDGLEARTSELEANQFSTTTKLSGEIIFGVAQAFGGGLDDDDDDDDDDNDDDDGTDLNNQVLAAGRTRLTFDTSFSGEDRLRARIQAGSFGRFNTTDDEGNTVLGNEARFGFDTDTDNQFEINHLSYLFPVGDAITVMAAAEMSHFLYFDFINPATPFSSSGRGAISRFGRFNPIYRLGTGTGAGISFDFIDQVGLQFAYLAGDAGNPSEGAGLLNGDYGALAQLTIQPFDDLTLALTYINSYTGTDDDGEGIGLISGTGSNRSRVRADTPTVTNSYGASLNFEVADFVQIGGWAGFSAVRAIETGDADVWNYAGTLGFPGLGGDGNLLGFIVGIQPRLTGTTGFTVEGRRSDPDTGLHVEGFYRYQLNDNISITPGVIWLTAPDHNNDNEDVIVGVLRTTFTF
ncbi:MAG: iron uptake porin [Cyanobacteria bacterium RM1_2_2]|nr:iron uptake porin [Cyanobacteria bacterium RM1_2_2]